MANIDFIPRPLQDINTTTRQPARPKTLSQKIKSIQAKVDTGIPRKAITPFEKENLREPVDLYRDDNYIKRVYGKALYHAQRRTTAKQPRPDSPTRPIPYKKTSGEDGWCSC